MRVCLLGRKEGNMTFYFDLELHSPSLQLLHKIVQPNRTNEILNSDSVDFFKSRARPQTLVPVIRFLSIIIIV